MRSNTHRNQDQAWRFRNGAPERITIYAPSQELNRTNADLGIYAQDSWSLDRLTMNLGVRFDYFNGGVPVQNVTAGLFVTERQFEAVKNKPNWTDINPRLGMSYDLLGDGRTALKASLGRYVGKEAVSVAREFNPIFTQVNSTNIGWKDADGDFVPDCDLLNPEANGECGAYSNKNFGQANPNAFVANENLTEGFGNRDYYWDLSAEVQHELAAGVSMQVGYYRNWSDHFRGLRAETSERCSSRTTRWSARRITIHSAPLLRWTPGCRGAVATRSAGYSTSRRRSLATRK